MPGLWTRRRLLNSGIGLLALVLTELGRGYYRPFVRAKQIHDFHVADTLGNSLGTVAAVFVTLAVFGRGSPEDARFLVVAPVCMFLYELAHPLLGRPIDPWDMLATVVAAGVAAAIYRLAHGRGAVTITRVGDPPAGA